MLCIKQGLNRHRIVTLKYLHIKVTDTFKISGVFLKIGVQDILYHSELFHSILQAAIFRLNLEFDKDPV